MTKQDGVDELAKTLYDIHCDETKPMFPIEKWKRTWENCSDKNYFMTMAHGLIDEGWQKPSPADAKGGLVPLDKQSLLKFRDEVSSEFTRLKYHTVERESIAEYAGALAMVQAEETFGTAPSKDVEQVLNKIYLCVNLGGSFDEDKFRKEYAKLSPPQARVVPTEEQISDVIKDNVNHVWITDGVEVNEYRFSMSNLPYLVTAISKLLKGEK